MNDIDEFVQEQAELKKEFAEMRMTFMELTLELTKSVGRSSDNFDTTLKLIQEQNRVLENIDKRLTRLEDWKNGLVGTTRQSFAKQYLAEANKNQDVVVVGLKNHFSKDSLDELMFLLDLEPTDFQGVHNNRCHLLVKDCIDRGRFWTLVRQAKEMRPNYLWPRETGLLGGT